MSALFFRKIELLSFEIRLLKTAALFQEITAGKSFCKTLRKDK